MPSNTTFYNFWIFDPTTDTGSTFLTFRSDIAGTAAGTNFIILDAALHTHDTQITALQTVRGIIYVPLIFQSANFFTAAGITAITSYADGLVIDVSLNQDSTGTVTININSLGTKSLLKYNSTGSSTINLTSGDLKANKEYLFRYSVAVGGFIWIDSTSGDQVNVGGTSGNFVSIASTGVLQDSGIADTSLVHLSGTEIITGAKTFNLPPNYASQTISGAATLTSASAPIVLVDTTSAAFQINLPSSPVAGEWFFIVDNTGQFSTHTLTLSPNGKNLDGVSSSLTFATNYAGIEIHYNGTSWNTSTITAIANANHRGLVPIAPNDATQFLNGATPTAFAQVKDSDLITTDVTTNNVVSNTKHGFAPKGDGDTTKFWRADWTEQTIISESYNSLINGGFDNAQWTELALVGTLTTITNWKFFADRFFSAGENASVQAQILDASAESGVTAKNMGAYKKITNNGKMLIGQVIEGVDTIPLRGKQVTFSVFMKASASINIRMAVLELQNAGTIDTFTALVPSVWGGASTDPTFMTNVAVITGAQTKAVTTSMQQFSVTVTVPSNSKNLICAIWSDIQLTANDFLYLTEAQLLQNGNATPSWKPRLQQEELNLCQRFAERISLDSSLNSFMSFGLSYTATVGYYGMWYKVTKRVAVDAGITFAAANQFNVWGANEVKAVSAISYLHANRHGCVITTTHTAVAFAGCALFLSNVSGNLAAWMMVDAEISVG